MPESTDPMVSLGYLIAAGAVTLAALGAYAAALAGRLARARARNAELRGAAPRA